MHRVVKKCVIPFAVLTVAGCSVGPTQIDPSLSRIAAPVLEKTEALDAPAAPFATPAQPAPYSTILAARYDELRYGFDNNLRALKISRLGNTQSLLPKVQPGAQIATSGRAELSLGINQVLYDGGVYRAKYASDDHAAVLRQVELLLKLNAEASEDIATFLSYRQNREKEQILRQLGHVIQGVLKTAHMRADAGIASQSDASLFSLKLYEIEADAEIARADAEADLSALDVDVHKLEETDFHFGDGYLPISVIHAIAKRDAAKSDLELAKKERNPRVALDGRMGLDPLTGLPSQNVLLDVQSKPMTLGGDVNVQHAREALRLADYELDREIRDAERESSRISARLEALRVQLRQTQGLIAKSDARFKQFRTNFLAGTSQLTEAAGLVETLRKSKEAEVSLRYEILNLQRQLAEHGGHFWDM